MDPLLRANPSLASGTHHAAATPYNWFDFESPGQHPPGGGAGEIPTVDAGGWRSVWQITLDGRRIPFKFFRQRGSSTLTRPVLALMHGMGLTIATFHGVSSYLFQTHDLLLPDYSSFIPGGRSDPANSGAKLYAETLWRIADALHLGRISVGGNSLGGGLCLLATVMQPARVDKLLLSNPACFPQVLPRTYRLARIPLLGELLMLLSPGEKLVGGVEYVGFVDKTRFDPELKNRYVRLLDDVHNRFRLMEIMRRLPANDRDLTAAPHLAQLGRICQPVLLTWGEQDPLLAPGSGDRLAATLPYVTFERYPDLSHMPHEEAPERIGPRWASFLNQ